MTMVELKNQLDSAHKGIFLYYFIIYLNLRTHYADIENFKRRTDDQAIQIRDLQDEMKTKDETNRFVFFYIYFIFFIIHNLT